ncbi:hypothetical protein HK405_014646, partial [Cladochytrium tenue]
RHSSNIQFGANDDGAAAAAAEPAGATLDSRARLVARSSSAPDDHQSVEEDLRSLVVCDGADNEGDCYHDDDNSEDGEGGVEAQGVRAESISRGRRQKPQLRCQTHNLRGSKRAADKPITVRRDQSPVEAFATRHQSFLSVAGFGLLFESEPSDLSASLGSLATVPSSTGTSLTTAADSLASESAAAAAAAAAAARCRDRANEEFRELYPFLYSIGCRAADDEEDPDSQGGPLRHLGRPQAAEPDNGGAGEATRVRMVTSSTPRDVPSAPRPVTGGRRATEVLSAPSSLTVPGGSCGAPPTRRPPSLALSRQGSTSSGLACSLDECRPAVPAAAMPLPGALADQCAFACRPTVLAPSASPLLHDSLRQHHHHHHDRNDEQLHLHHDHHKPDAARASLSEILRADSARRAASPDLWHALARLVVPAPTPPLPPRP